MSVSSGWSRCVSAGVVAAIVSAAPGVWAADTVDGMSAIQLRALPKERLAALPYIDVSAVLTQYDLKGKPAEQVTRGLVLLLENSLYQLRYYQRPSVGRVTPELAEAVRAFQRRIGSPASGVLLYGEHERLMSNVESLAAPSISLSGGGDGETPTVRTYGTDGIFASGSWAIKGERLAYPANVSEIRCSKAEGVCRDVSANLSYPNNGFLGWSYNLSVGVEIYLITKWAPGEVTAESSGGCRAVTLTINVPARQVFQVSRDRGPDECPGALRLGQPRVATLTGSLAVGQALERERGDGLTRAMAPQAARALREAVDLLSPAR